MQRTNSPAAAARRGEGEGLLELPLGETAFFFDVDGTLLDIVAEPTEAIADRGLVDLMSRLIRRTNGTVALVSGRTLADLDRIFAPLELPAAALHGGEIRFPDGTRVTAPPELMDPVRLPVYRFVAANPGLMLEDKGATLAVHFRRRPELAAAVVAFLNDLGADDGVAVQEGKFVAELKPMQFGKGAAIAALMEHPPFRGKRPVFYGDDLTDESGFAFVQSHGGLAVRIDGSDAPTVARARLADPAELRRHLRRLLATSADTAEAPAS